MQSGQENECGIVNIRLSWAVTIVLLSISIRLLVIELNYHSDPAAEIVWYYPLLSCENNKKKRTLTSSKTHIHVLIYFQEQFTPMATPFTLNQSHSACDKWNT